MYKIKIQNVNAKNQNKTNEKLFKQNKVFRRRTRHNNDEIR